MLDAASAIGMVVLDLGRGQGVGRAAALSYCDLIVVVAAGNVTGIIAARRVCASLPATSVGAVLRRGSVRQGDAAELLGVPVLATLPDVLRRDSTIAGSWIKIGRAIADGMRADGMSADGTGADGLMADVR